MNNRQANGRRRGRGGQQQRGGNPNQGNGNRIDNRARGNAAQLLEKYKNLARDAQMQGDRVNAEYYLQFADHYFRVLSESRSRFEEQDRQRRDSRADEGDDDFDYEADGNRAEGNREQEYREERQPRESRDDRRNGHANGNGYASGRDADEAQGFEAEEREERQDRGSRRGRGRGRRDEVASAGEESHAIDAAVLPPAFGIEAEPAGEEEAEAPRKPRRRRAARNDDEVETPSAA